MAERPRPIHGTAKIGRMPTREDLFVRLTSGAPLSPPPKVIVIKGPRANNPTKPKNT